MRPLRSPFKLGAIVLIGSGALTCTCAAYDVDVGQLWGTLLQVVGARQRVAASRELIVRAGQRLRVDGRTVIVEDVPAEAITQGQAWSEISLKDGWIAFQGQTLESAAAEFNRHNSRQLVIGDVEVGQLRVGGKFRVTDVDGFLAALALTHGVKAVHSPAQGDQPEAIVLVGGNRSGSAVPEWSQSATRSR